MNVTRDSLVLVWTPGRPSPSAPYRKTFLAKGEKETEELPHEDGTKEGSTDGPHEEAEAGIMSVPRLPEAEYIGLTEGQVDAAASQTMNVPVGYIVQYKSERTGKHQVNQQKHGLYNYKANR